MEPDFWHERWQTNQIGFHQADINPHLRQFWPAIAVPSEAPVFVPLAGKSLDLRWLHDLGHPVVAVELSPLAVGDFFAGQGLDPGRRSAGATELWEAGGYRIHCGDFFALTAADLTGVGGVYDRASLIALPPSLRARYAAHLLAILPEAAPILLVSFEYEQDKMSGPPFSVGEEEIRRLYEPARTVRSLHRLDILGQEPRFQTRGLTYLREAVYGIGPRG